jgi:hypothetical protein
LAITNPLQVVEPGCEQLSFDKRAEGWMVYRNGDTETPSNCDQDGVAHGSHRDMCHSAEAVQLRVDIEYQVAGNRVARDEHLGFPRHCFWVSL